VSGAEAEADPERRRHLRRAVVASAIGTAIEWYDFFLYGIASALLFPKIFFPAHDPYTGTLLSFSTYFVGFIGRPIGAAIFGHYGDRLGRKASLIATLLLMGAATASIGLVPGYARVGIAGPILLTVGRVLQGIAVGGEWGGSVLLAAEWARQGNRGLAASWPQWGAPAGLLLANGAAWLTTTAAGDAAYAGWAWRVPVLASLLLVAIGFWIRIGIHEPPAFARLRESGQTERAPVRLVLRKNGREVVLTALLRTGQQSAFYVFTTWVLTYAVSVLHFARADAVHAVFLTAAASMVAIPLFGHLSDRFGRRRIIAIGIVAMLGWPFVYFRMIDSGSVAVAMVAIVLSLPIHDLQYGPQAAIIAESFPASLRYSGSSLGYQLASLTAGGPAPLIATWLLHRTGSSTAIAAYLSVCAVVSLVSLLLLHDHSGRDLEAS
jgi:MFS family permease